MKSGNGLHSVGDSSLAGVFKDTGDHDPLLDTAEPAEAGNAPDPFDPAALRLPDAFADTVGVRKLLTKVPVRRPKRAGVGSSVCRPRYAFDARGNH